MTDELPSKTQRKKQMLALQDLGAELVALNEDQLTAIALPDNLRDAVLEAKGIVKFEARRRQLQYIGKLMRTVDPEPIRTRLNAWKATSRTHTSQLHRIERWRERLLADDGALAMFAAEYPGSDVQHLRTLIASVKRDQALNKPLKNYRELFRVVRMIVAKSSAIERTK